MFPLVRSPEADADNHEYFQLLRLVLPSGFTILSGFHLQNYKMAAVP